MSWELDEEIIRDLHEAVQNVSSGEAVVALAIIDLSKVMMQIRDTLDDIRQQLKAIHKSLP